MMIVHFFAFLIICTYAAGSSNAGGINLNFSLSQNTTSNRLYMLEGEIQTLYATIQYSVTNKSLHNKDIILKCWIENSKIGILKNWTDYYLPSLRSEASIEYINATIKAKRLGGSELLCSASIQTDTNGTLDIYQGEMAYILVKRVTTIPEIIFRFCMIFFIIFITFVMGCDLDRAIIWQYVRKPVSPSIGFACQFLLMPLMSFGLAKLTNIDNAFAFGLLTIGCSPGGGASNVWTVLFGGDLNLSMTMTCISSCAALFMMPFWLFVLRRFFIDTTVVSIPYKDIGLNLLQVVLPIGIGMLFRWKFEKQALKLTKWTKLFGLLLIIFILSFGSYANLYIYKLIGDYPILIPIGASLPWLGFIFGYLLAIMTHRTKQQAIAISLETGFQNIGIAILILRFSMPQPAGDLGAVMPIVVALFTPLPLYICLAALTIKRKNCDHRDKLGGVELDPQNQEEQTAFIK